MIPYILQVQPVESRRVGVKFFYTPRISEGRGPDESIDSEVGRS